jgi:hypothetical protein
LLDKRVSLIQMRTAKTGRILNLVLLAMASIIFALQALGYHYISDDAYISFRYALNWAKGYGPVYNVGETVEGYTNFLWMALLAVLHKAGFDVLPVAQMLGVALGLATILLTYKFSRRWYPASSPWAVLAACLLALNVSFAAYTTGGLETHLFTFLVLLSALLHLQEVDDPQRFPWSALTMALIVMTRPDGLVFVGLAGLHRLWHQRGRITRQDLLWGLTLVLVYAPYYLWRFSYYGYPFPNTFYAKVGGGPERLLRGVKYVSGFIWEYGGGPFAFLVVLLLILRQLDRDCAYLTWLVGGFMAYVVWIGGDSLIEYRFLLAVTPLLYLLVQQSLRRALDLVARWLQKRSIRPDRVLFLLTSVALLALIYLLVAQISVQASRLRIVRTRVSYENLATAGQWLAEQVPPEASLAVHHAGAMPFHSGLRTIDMFGLNDLHIAHTVMPDMGTGKAGHEKRDVDYVLSRRPTYVAPIPLIPRPLSLKEWRDRFEDSTWFPGIKEMLDSPGFESLYAPRSVDFASIMSPDHQGVLGYERYFNFFQLRDATLATNQAFDWDFGQDNGMAGWGPWNGMEAQGATESSVHFLSITADPFMGISGLQLWATPCDRLIVRMRLTDGAESQVFWLNDFAPHGSEFQSLKFEPRPDGEFYTYTLPIGNVPSWAGTITGLRLDPTNQPAEIEIDYIDLERVCKTDS